MADGDNTDDPFDVKEDGAGVAAKKGEKDGGSAKKGEKKGGDKKNAAAAAIAKAKASLTQRNRFFLQNFSPEGTGFFYRTSLRKEPVLYGSHT